MKKELIYCCIVTFIMVFTSCTVYDNPAPFFEDTDRIESPNQRKILLISIDGLVGRELQKEVPTNLSNILDKSKYTFNSISDKNSSSASTWATMMTGVTSAEHHVEDDSFRAKADESDQHAAITFSPTFFYRLLFTRPEYNTTAISSWGDLVSKLLVETETQIISNSDLESKDAAVAELENEDPEVMIVSFQAVERAGESGGYSRDNASYNSAIEEVDAYVGEIMTALEQRKNYDKEDWLVMITSNHGGGVDGTTGGDSFEYRNTFTILHYKGFKKQEIAPSLINSINFTQFQTLSTNYIPNIAEATDGSQYNFTGQEMAVEFKFKKNYHLNHTTQAFTIGKTARKNHGGSGTGWGIATANDKLIFYITFDDGVKYEYNYGVNINDFKWHHIAFSLKKISEKSVQLTLFNDGITANTATITTTGAVNGTMVTTAPLFIGIREGHNTSALGKDDLQFADVRIYDKALESKDASRLSCIINELPSSESFKSNLIADYKLNSVRGDLLINEVSGKPNLKFTNTNISKSSVSLIATKCNEDDRSNILISGEDVTSMILYWLRITPEASWKLKGNKILDKFEAELVKIDNK